MKGVENNLEGLFKESNELDMKIKEQLKGLIYG